MADQLDALGIAWEYEPRLFVFAVSEEGHCTEGFRPDFYLPEHDLYIEVTQAKVQTLKNGKVRKLRELGERVYLFARVDFERPPGERIEEILRVAAEAA